MKQIGTTGDLIPSPKDERDYALSSISPDIVRYPEECPPPFDLTISNQLIFPSCVGHTCATVKQEKELREKYPVTFDGNWIYFECKKIDGHPNMPGTYFRAGMQVLKDVGAKPLDKDTDPSRYRIETYARVDDMTFEGLKKAIFIYGAIFAGFRGSNEGWRGEVIRAPRTGEDIWGHAVALIGYDKNYLIGQNSWGLMAHKNGIFKTTKDYLPFEAWVVVLDRPNELKPQSIKTAWVASEFLEFKGGVMRTTNNLNVRKEPNLSSERIKLLPKGTIVQLVHSDPIKADGWTWREICLTN